MKFFFEVCCSSTPWPRTLPCRACRARLLCYFSAIDASPVRGSRTSTDAACRPAQSLDCPVMMRTLHPSPFFNVRISVIVSHLVSSPFFLPPTRYPRAPGHQNKRRCCANAKPTRGSPVEKGNRAMTQPRRHFHGIGLSPVA
jgi:hypothetical protein